MQMRATTQSDLSVINAWRDQRKIPVLRFIPPIGVMIEDVASGFLLPIYQVPDLAWIELFTSNPEAGIFDVNRAVELIVGKLEAIAFMMGVRHVFSISAKSGIVKKAKRMGFSESPEKFSFLSKELGA